MNKTELIAAVANRTGDTKRASAAAVDAIFTEITGALQAGEKVSIVGFGALDVKARAARVGRNPKTGEEVSIPARNSVSFKAGKGLKDCVNS